jgi:hypothetical protein
MHSSEGGEDASPSRPLSLAEHGRSVGRVREAATRPKPPLAVRLSGGRNTRFADAGAHSPDSPVTTQSCQSRSPRERPL